MLSFATFGVVIGRNWFAVSGNRFCKSFTELFQIGEKYEDGGYGLYYSLGLHGSFVFFTAYRGDRCAERICSNIRAIY